VKLLINITLKVPLHYEYRTLRDVCQTLRDVCRTLPGTGAAGIML